MIGASGAVKDQGGARTAGAIAGAAAIIMLGSVLSRLLGLVREQLAAGLFGTGDQMAAFTIAENVHTLLFDLLVSGMLQSALVPVLAGLVAVEAIRRASGTILTLVVGLAIVVSIVGTVAAPQIVHLMTAIGNGTGDRDPETIALTVRMVRIILPAVILLAAGTVLSGVLYAIDRVTGPALAVAARNAIVVLSMVLLSGRLGVESMAVGVLAGAVALVAVQVVPLVRAGAMPRPGLHLGDPAVRKIGRLYIPIFLGLFINTIAVVIDRNLAWRAETDALGAMRYATTLVQLVLGLIAAAISLASLSTLSRHFSNGDEEGFQATLGRVLALVTVLIVPAVFGLAVLARPIVDLLFGHGETGPRGTHLIVIALLGYLPGALCAAYDQVLIFAFYARQNTRTPVLVGVAAVAVYFAVALPLGSRYGMIGLVIANSAQFAAHLALMVWLGRRGWGRIGAGTAGALILRCLSVGVGMALVTGLVWLGLGQLLPTASGIGGLGRELVLAGVPVAAGLSAYWAGLRVAGVRELDEVVAMVAGRVRRTGRPPATRVS